MYPHLETHMEGKHEPTGRVMCDRNSRSPHLGPEIHCPHTQLWKALPSTNKGTDRWHKNGSWVTLALAHFLFQSTQQVSHQHKEKLAETLWCSCGLLVSNSLHILGTLRPFLRSRQRKDHSAVLKKVEGDGFKEPPTFRILTQDEMPCQPPALLPSFSQMHQPQWSLNELCLFPDSLEADETQQRQTISAMQRFPTACHHETETFTK